MRKSKYIFHMALWTTVVLFLIGVLVNGVTFKGNLLEINSTALKYTNEYEVEILNDEKIEFDLNVDDIIIEYHENDIIKIIEKSNYELEENEMLKIDRKSDSLKICRDDKKIKMKRNNINRLLQVYLPKEYQKKLEISNNVGDISIDSDLILDELKINQNVGDLSINYVDTNFYELESHVGDIEIEYISGCGEISSNVGNINCGIGNIKDDIKIKSNIGDIEVLVDVDTSFNLDASYGVGDFKSNLELNNYKNNKKSVKGSYGTNPKNELLLETNTGDIKLNKK